MGVNKPGQGFSSSAVIYQDLLLLTAGESGIALNKLTGEQVWASNVHKESSESTPVLFQQADKTLAAMMSGSSLFAVDVTNGSVVWSYDWRSIMDPVVVGDRIFLSNNYRKGSSLISIASGSPEVVWEKSDLKGLFSGYVLKDDFVYGCTDEGNFHCIDLKDGSVKWQHGIGGIGSLCLAQDKLIVINTLGKLLIIQATPDRYQEIATYQVFKMSPADEQKRLSEQPWGCWTIPVLANGCIYVRNSDGDVACLDVRK
jgi:outer membrane protein assembly factor BamB